MQDCVFTQASVGCLCTCNKYHNVIRQTIHFFHLSVCLTVLSIASRSIPFHPTCPVHASICPCIHLSMHPSVHASICPSIHLSIHPSIHLSVISVSLPTRMAHACLSLHLFCGPCHQCINYFITWALLGKSLIYLHMFWMRYKENNFTIRTLI